VKPSGTADAAPAICFVVTCKGRLHHLRQTLPALVTQTGAECVVVDYDCPDHAYLWVSEHFPNVRIARVLDAPTFNLSRARNIGAMVAKAPWLCFIDADIALAGDFSVRVIPMLLADHFLSSAADALGCLWNSDLSARPFHGGRGLRRSDRGLGRGGR
jgi:glycosyltransferase involved in cell wall biosynthesis